MIKPKHVAWIRVRFAEEPHGTRHRYLSGCRCVPCRAAASRYECEREAAQRAGDYRGLVPATPVLAHIMKLSKAGIGYKAVAEAAGIGKRPYRTSSTESSNSSANIMQTASWPWIDRQSQTAP